MSRYSVPVFTTVLISSVLLAVFPQEGSSYVRKSLVNGGIYSFQNVGDYGFLTSVSGSNAIVTDGVWRNGGVQSWRISKATFSTVYMMRPLSEGPTGKVALSLSSTAKDFLAHLRSSFPAVRKEPYLLGISGKLYWSVVPSVNNFYMLMNDETGLCLESRGAGKPVGVSPCNYAVYQQWAVRSLSK